MADRGPGRVILVGGGPGAEDLITVRGLDRLMTADVVIADRLAPVTLLSRLGPKVEIIDAGRAPGQPTLSYDEIAHLMIAVPGSARSSSGSRAATRSSSRTAPRR